MAETSANSAFSPHITAPVGHHTVLISGPQRGAVTEAEEHAGEVGTKAVTVLFVAGVTRMTRCTKLTEDGGMSSAPRSTSLVARDSQRRRTTMPGAARR